MDTTFDERLRGYVPERVRRVFVHSGSIENGMLSLSDVDAVGVILSRPVVDHDRSKLNESLHAAVDAALTATLSPDEEILVHVITQLPQTGVLGHVAKTLASSESAEWRVFTQRFLRALRSRYEPDFIASAFATHNMQVNTHAVDFANTLGFLSAHNLGALTSAFSVHKNVAIAWQQMGVHGYLELLRSGLVVSDCDRVRRLTVLVLAKTHEKDLRKIHVTVASASAYDVIVRTTAAPNDREFGPTDFAGRDVELRELARVLVRAADSARVTDGITDDFIKEIKDVLVTPHGAKAAPALRRLYDAIVPIDTISAVLYSRPSTLSTAKLNP